MCFWDLSWLNPAFSAVSRRSGWLALSIQSKRCRRTAFGPLAEFGMTSPATSARLADDIALAAKGGERQRVITEVRRINGRRVTVQRRRSAFAIYVGG
jgi:hypothetical protein